MWKISFKLQCVCSFSMIHYQFISFWREIVLMFDTISKNGFLPNKFLSCFCVVENHIANHNKKILIPSINNKTSMVCDDCEMYRYFLFGRLFLSEFKTSVYQYSHFWTQRIFLNTFRINGHIITYYNTGYYVSSAPCRDYCDHNFKCDKCVISTGYASKDEIKSF